MGEQEIARFLSSLATDAKVSASTQNQALNALWFLYNEVLEKKMGLIQGVVQAKRPRRLPVVLTKEEVRRLLGCLEGTPWLMALPGALERKYPTAGKEWGLAVGVSGDQPLHGQGHGREAPSPPP